MGILVKAAAFASDSPIYEWAGSQIVLRNNGILKNQDEAVRLSSGRRLLTLKGHPTSPADYA